jgi:hypothetical protein
MKLTMVTKHMWWTTMLNCETPEWWRLGNNKYQNNIVGPFVLHLLKQNKLDHIV